MIKMRQLGRIAARWMLDHSIWVSAFIVLLSMLPFLVLGQDSYVTIHDNLDDTFIRHVLVARSGLVFEPRGRVEQVMNGVPRVCLPPGLNVLTGLFVVISPFDAYLVNFFLVRAVAFGGMYLLVSRYVTEDRAIAAGAAACFAVLPFYSIFGLSIAGQPLLAFAFLNITGDCGRPLDFLAVAVFALYFSLFQIGVFIVAVLLVWFAALCVRNRRINVSFAFGILLLSGAYLIANYNLLDSLYLRQSLVPHRSEYDVYQRSVPLLTAIVGTVRNFLRGQYHAVSLHSYIALVILPLAGLAAYVKRISIRSLVGLLALCLAFSTLHGFQNWDALTPLKERVTLFRAFQFGRFHRLHPLLWYVLLALGCSMIAKLDLGHPGSGRALALALIAFQLLYVVRHNAELTYPVLSLTKQVLGVQDRTITYAGFYSEHLFQEIGSCIGRPQESYRVVTLGLHPAVAQYNGFYTLDAYMNLYPLEYKHRFREIIAPELEKSERWRQYFDGWGNRCYFFSSELDGFLNTKSVDAQVSSLAFNVDAFKEIGGEYILSAAEIRNHLENDLRLLNTFENRESPWRIWLYQVQ